MNAFDTLHKLEHEQGLVTKKPGLTVEFSIASGAIVLLWAKDLAIGAVLHLASGDAVSVRRIEKAMLKFRLESASPRSFRDPVEGKVLAKSGADLQGIKSALERMGINSRAEILDEGARPVSGRAVPLEGRLLIRKAADGCGQASQREKTRVLIIDDSRSMRQVLRKVLESDERIEVVGEAESAEEADRLIPKLHPSVLSLDIHMPKEDGVSFLRRLMVRQPLPVVVLTSLNIEESEKVFEALALGAVDCVQKPSLDQLTEIGPLICEKIRVAGRESRLQVQAQVQEMGRAERGKAKARAPASPHYKSELIAIGSSTGGIQTLEGLFRELPDEIPPILIVQHIPPNFSAAFARRLDGFCPFEVKEAASGDLVLPNRVLIAPGGLQMRLVRKHGVLQVEVFDGPRESLHKPSVDVLFSSVAKEIGSRAVGAILTGMGSDGAKGLLEMRKRGAITFAQSEESCVVFGMPKVAIELGAAMKVIHRRHLPVEIVKAAQTLS